MQQFEYTTHTITLKNNLFSKKQPLDTSSLENTLNLMGKKGWELVSQFSHQKNGFSQYTVLLFKRPISLGRPPQNS